MKIKLFTSVVILFTVILSSVSHAQDECDQLPDDKKIKKLYEQSQDRKKYKDYQKRMMFLKEAIDLDDECAPCLWEFSKYTFSNARANGLPYTGTKKYLTQLEQVCPNFHSEIYYNLGIVYYEEGNMPKAIEYFKKFKAFKADDDKKYTRSYDEKLNAVNNMLPEIEFQANFFGKPVPFEPSLVKNVSTPADEYLPMISPDNEIIFYTRVRQEKNLGDITSRTIEELSTSTRELLDQDFDGGAGLPNPFNDGGDNYGGVSISVDNKVMFVCACHKNETGYNNCDIYSTKYKRVEDPKTKKIKYEWTELENLGPNVNGESSWEAQPSISADGKTLYFATNRPSSKGIDIYESKLQEDGTWGPAKRVKGINTDGNDKSPFMHTDSRTLYFVSDSRRGAGGFDIYYTRQNDDGSWDEPTNIGYPINSERDEEGLVVSTDGQTAYFSSGRMEGGAGMKDIYSFTLHKEARPDKVMIVKGNLNKDESPVNAKIKMNFSKSKEIQEFDVSSDDGTYALAVTVKEEEDVLMTVKKENSAFSSKLISKEDMNSNGGVVKGKDMEVKKIKKGSTYTINDINFATNSSELNEKSKIIIDGFVDFLKENKSVTVDIQGHTDDVGANDENLKLSQDRADQVMKYIVSQGIDASRLKAKGYGESKPKLPNSNDNNRRINRRTDFLITGV